MSNKIDYKKELEAASRSMIMIHDPNLLIKLILRTIVSKVEIKHAGMILYEPKKDSFVLNISRGETGVKIPAGYARFDKKSPVMQLFTNKAYKSLIANKNAIVSDELNKLIWQESILNTAVAIKKTGGRKKKGAESNGAAKLLHSVSEQMQMYNTVACVPAYYQDQLMAILFLGQKENNKKLVQEELDFFAALASDVAMAIKNAQLFEGLRKEAERNRQLFLQTTIVLGSTIEAKDKYTHGHTERVTGYSVSIARQMMASGSNEIDEKFIENLYISGILHDIGKIAVPESILNKTGQLTEEEFAIMRNHTLRGVEILKPLANLEECIAGVKYHHERYDGKGYPEGLKGEDIPMMAAIIAVADTYDAMTTDRPYRKGLTKEVAVAEIQKNIGVQFNPRPAKAFIELVKAGKI